jgi:DNA-binding HxlR family transcriptional regulator
MSRSYGQRCPIARTLDILGDRWTMLILRDLFFGRRKFSEFLEHSPGMPTRMLSERLKALEAHGLIERRVYSAHPLRAEYHLTERGRSTEPVIEAIVLWGVEHVLGPEERRPVIEDIRRHVPGSSLAARLRRFQREAPAS